MRKRNREQQVEKIWLDIDESCEASGLGRSKLYQLIGAGHVRSIKVGRRRLVCPKSLRAMGTQDAS